MNPKEVASRLPLHKFEIYQDVDNVGHLKYSECFAVSDAGSSSHSFKAKAYWSFDSMEEACERALAVYLHGPDGFEVKSAKASFVPRTRIVLKEYCRGRDGGSSWADPYNDVVKSGGISIDIRMDDTDDTQHYDTCYAPFNPLYGVSHA